MSILKEYLAKKYAEARAQQPRVAAPAYTASKPAPQGGNQLGDLVGAGTAMVGGAALARSGVGDMAFANRTNEIFDDATRRLRGFSGLQQPTRTVDAVNAYKDLTDTMEQMSRSGDDLLSKYPSIINLTGGRFGIGKDSIRQEVVKSVLRNLHPEADMAGAAITDRTKDVIGRVRASGFADYDRGADIMKNFGKLQGEAAAGLQLAGKSGPHLGRVTGMLKNLGKAKSGVGILAALGGGAWLAGRPEKQAAVSDAQTNASAVASPLSALLLSSGLNDLVNTPKDVLVSYGTDDRLGAGHASPGRNIAAIVNEDSRFRKNKVRAIEAPATQGLMTTSNPDALKGRYALGVDTGWGILDDKYNKNWGQRDFATGGSLYRDAMIEAQGPFGGKSLIAGNDVLSRVQRVLKLHPDAPSTVSGNNYGDLTGNREPKGVSGLLSRLFTGKGKYYNTTYGDGSAYTGNNLSFVGKAHPAANVDTSPALAKNDYRRLVAEELAASNKGTSVDDWLTRIGDRKIISVSGASRGDSVGARSASIYEAMRRGGDDYFILGLGGKNKAAQQAIAAAAGIPESSMGFAGFTKRFTPLAQNSDLHFMGMGGASPYEMLSSAGRAPIVRATDEEVFDRVLRRKNPKSQARKGAPSDKVVSRWLDMFPRDDGQLNRGAGIAGKQIELARKALDSGNISDPLVREALEDAASYSGAREWMNPTRLVDESGKVLVGAGEHSKLKRGLDGIVDYLNKNKVRAVAFGDGGGALDKLMADLRDGRLSGLDDAARLAVRGEIAASKAGLADEVFKHWKNSRNMTRLKGTGKAALGATALAPLLASIFGKDTTKQPLQKLAAADDSLGAVGDAALLAAGGSLVDSGVRAELTSNAMKNLQLRAHTKNHWNTAFTPALMDEYALAGQRLMNSNPLVIPSKWIGQAVPVSQWGTALTNPAAQLARLADGLGATQISKSLIRNERSAKALQELRSAAEHYAGVASRPHAQFIKELDHVLPWLNLPKTTRREIRTSRTIGDALRVLDRVDTPAAKWQVGEFANKFLAPGRGPHAYGPVNRTLGRGAMLGGVTAATLGLGNLIRRWRSGEET